MSQNPHFPTTSDLWKAYDCLKNEGYDHLTVNHSLNFVNPDTGAHTQGIENTWWGVKRSFPRTGTSKELFDGYLQEYMWRQQYGEDPFGNIIKHIADLYRSIKGSSVSLYAPFVILPPAEKTKCISKYGSCEP